MTFVLSRGVRRVLIGTGVTVGVVFGGGIYSTRLINKKRARFFYDDFSITPFELQIPYEDVLYTTEDGVTLNGWYLSSLVPTNRVIIVCTGYNGSKAEMIGIAAALWRAGNNLMLFDFRHRSPNHDHNPQQSIGYLEKHDARAALHYVRKRMPEARIGVVGTSMGGAVALQIAAEEPSVLSVVTDSAFSNLHDTVLTKMRHFHVPLAELFCPLVSVLNKLIYGYYFADVRPIDSVKRLDGRPFLCIHGTEDSIVPVEHAHELFENANTEDKELWIHNYTEHCGAYFNNRPAYVRRISDFFDRTLSREPTFQSARLSVAYSEGQKPDPWSGPFVRKVTADEPTKPSPPPPQPSAPDSKVVTTQDSASSSTPWWQFWQKRSKPKSEP